MGYGSTSLNDWRDEALRIATAKGFTDASPAEDIALMHSELSEALEDIRAGRPLDKMFYTRRFEAEFGGEKVSFDKEQIGPGPFDDPNKPCGVPSEMADVLIRVLHFCGKHNIDIERAVRQKMRYNEYRPFKHGGKKL